MKSYKTTTKSISKSPAAHNQPAHNYASQNEPQFASSGPPPSGEPPTRAAEAKPLGLTKPAILAYITLTETADFSVIQRALSTVRTGDSPEAEDSVSAETVFNFLSTLLPDDTATWTERLQNRVARYATWPADTFTIVGRREKIRIRVIDRVVTEITRHEDQPL